MPGITSGYNPSSVPAKTGAAPFRVEDAKGQVVGWYHSAHTAVDDAVRLWNKTAEMYVVRVGAP